MISENCLYFDFNHCRKVDSTKPKENLALVNIDWLADAGADEKENSSQVFEFIDVPSYVALLSCSMNEPVYFVLIQEKGKAGETLRDWDIVSLKEKCIYFNGRYLQKIRSRNAQKKTVPNS